MVVGVPHRAASRARRATRPGRRTPGATSAAPTRGARSRSTPRRGIAYFPTGSPTYDYYGADRIGSNLYANSLIALDARTGKRLWHYQVVHHDLWDYDLTAAPQLVTVRHDGKTIDAVAQAAKHGFLFVFDRVTGKPLWPIEERPIPKSTVPGEQTWPTQPFPTKPAPFARQSMTDDDLTPLFLTPEERATWIERLRKAKHGLFAPLSTEHETVAVPGAVGGANWGNTAANPAKGLVYVISQDFPSFYKLSENPPNLSPSAAARAFPPEQRGRALYATSCQACHGPERAGHPDRTDAGRPRHARALRGFPPGGAGRSRATCRRFRRPTMSRCARCGASSPTIRPRLARRAAPRGAAAAPPPVPDGPVVAVRRRARRARRGARPRLPPRRRALPRGRRRADVALLHRATAWAFPTS